MGIYNPNQPQILGQEWVPIREENLLYNQILNNVELGHTFTIGSTAEIIDFGRFYISKMPEELFRNQVFTMNLYRRGEESLSGPIRRVVIPCNNGGITGAHVALSVASTVAEALQDASDRKFIQAHLGLSSTVDISMFFAVNQYQNLLDGKRILGVNFLYAGEQSLPAQDDSGQRESLDLTLQNTAGFSPFEYPAVFTGDNPAFVPVSPFQAGVTNRIALGDTNVFFTPTSGVNVITSMPWRYQDLQRFEASSVTLPRIEVHLHSNGVDGVGPSFDFDYAALEVLYCEETRVGAGCAVFGAGTANTALQYILDANIVVIRQLDGTANVTLAANQEYTVTLAQNNVGDSPLRFTVDRIGPQPEVSAIRELYALPTHTGVQLNIPAPPTPDIVGQVFTVEDTHVLPQLTLHRVSDNMPLTVMHVYGRQAVAQVYGTITATQDIDDSATASTTYSVVRFYARRFGNTTVPLTIAQSVGTINASISPAEFDALDEIIDGWKEISLTLSTPVTMGGTGNPQWQWSATSELAGNRWEVLGAAAPATLSTPNPSAPFTQVAYNERPDSATYGIDEGDAVVDVFNRVTANGWGNATSGQAWSVVSGAAGDYSTDGSSGIINDSALVNHEVSINVGSPNQNVFMRFRIPVAPTGASANVIQDFHFRRIDASNFYSIRISTNLAGTMSFTLNKTVAGVGTTLATGSSLTLNVAQAYGIRVYAVGSQLQAKFWNSSTTSEPDWQISATDTDITTGNLFSVFNIPLNITNALPYQFRYDDLFAQQFTGATVLLGWMPGIAPIWSTTVDDPSSDAMVMFSQTPAAVSGFALNMASLPLTGIGLNCGLAPGFVPTALAYNRLTWNYDQTTQIVDVFNRTAGPSSWGNASSGQTYSGTTGLSVTPGAGSIALTATNTLRTARLPVSLYNTIGWADFSGNIAASGVGYTAGIALRDDGTDSVQLGVLFNTDHTLNLYVTVVSDGTSSTVESIPFVHVYVPGTTIHLHWELYATTIKANAWVAGLTEPDGWMVETGVGENVEPTGVSAFAVEASGVGPPATITYTLIKIFDGSLGYTEIQRSDTLTDWQTIMKATNHAVTGFNDYEARVDIATSYRVRNVNLYGFVGPWSSTLTATLTAPGVTATNLTATDHVLIFTTNSVQSGASNLAYAPGWEGEVQEDFNFPESAGQVIQTMYGRDFATVFRPLERGGSNFSRTLLVQAAAISPETLPDFSSLRDMAWADVPYICVRDEDGNRWLSNVSVPSGVALRSRRLYLAPVAVLEVTDTPTPVDPTWPV